MAHQLLLFPTAIPPPEPGWGYVLLNLVRSGAPILVIGVVAVGLLVWASVASKK
jgi:hypothetical protein